MFILCIYQYIIVYTLRTITAPVDYEGILKMQGASGLPLSSHQLSSADSAQTMSSSTSLSRWQALPATKAKRGESPR